MPFQLNPDPGTAALQIALLLLLVVLLGVAGRLITFLIIRACSRKPKLSPQAQQVSEILARLRAQQSAKSE